MMCWPSGVWLRVRSDCGPVLAPAGLEDCDGPTRQGDIVLSIYPIICKNQHLLQPSGCSLTERWFFGWMGIHVGQAYAPSSAPQSYRDVHLVARGFPGYTSPGALLTREDGDGGNPVGRMSVSPSCARRLRCVFPLYAPRFTRVERSVPGVACAQPLLLEARDDHLVDCVEEDAACITSVTDSHGLFLILWFMVDREVQQLVPPEMLERHHQIITQS